MAEKNKEKLTASSNSRNLPLNGKLITSVDGSQLSEGDFQILKNMRYGELSPRSIAGMTKINTAVINATYLKPRAGFHFRKAQPAESHVLAQSWNTGLTTARVYENTTAIPSQGAFTATQLWSDTAGANIGEFSDAPDGSMVYANGKDTCVWGGNEYRCAGFIVGDLDETVKYDYTDRVINTLSDSENVATILKAGTASGNDANTVLLLNCDGANGGTTFDDSAVGATVEHDATAVGNANTSTAQFKFGTASAYFDGAGDWLTVADHDDFDFSGGVWTVDMQVMASDVGAGYVTETLYFQGNATDYIHLYMYGAGGTFYFGIKVVAASVTVVQAVSGYYSYFYNVWHHLEFVENGNNWYIFVDGTLVASTSDADRAANYGSVVYIGANSGGTETYKGYIDEIRVSNSARHTANFSAPTAVYSAVGNGYVFVGATRPIKGIKFYVGTPNTTACVPTVSYWANSVWNLTTSLVDGTASPAGTALGQTGSIAFSTTVSLAKSRFYNNVYAYWYLVTFPSIDNTTTVYYVTLDAPFQAIVDLWDGNPRYISAYLRYTTLYIDEAVNVLEIDYVSGDTLSYSNVGGLTSAQYIVVGFAERMTGLDFALVGGQVNAVTTILTVSYWDGDSWVSVGNVNDGTKASTASLGQSGTVTWDAPSEALEFKNSVSGSDLWYFYKVNWNATLTASTYIDQITGITAQKKIRGYSWPVLWQNRVWLLNNNSGFKNSALCSATDTVCVFNGGNSTILYFGNEEDLTCGATLFSRFAGEIYDNLIVFKKNEVWIVNGTSPSDYRQYRIGTNYGCVAPKTLKSCDIAYEIAPGLTKHILIWQSENAVVMFDGNAVSPISTDIKNYFDKTKTECIPDSMKSFSTAFYDESNFEYHWCFASGAAATTLNKELVYDVLKRKWYEIDRATGAYIQLGFSVRDTNGINYTFGTLDTGYMERLEYGTKFDENSIVSQFKIPDIAPGGYTIETIIRNIRLIALSKSNTTNLVAVTHYGDGITTSSSTAVTLPLTDSTHRFVRPIRSVQWGNFLFHSVLFSLTTTNENCGFEPLGIGIIFDVVRESVI